jgi:hypothetical protein
MLFLNMVCLTVVLAFMLFSLTMMTMRRIWRQIINIGMKTSIRSLRTGRSGGWRKTFRP